MTYIRMHYIPGILSDCLGPALLQGNGPVQRVPGEAEVGESLPRLQNTLLGIDQETQMP